jgi:hypothetical protein
MRMHRPQQVHVLEVVDRGTPPTRAGGLIQRTGYIQYAINVFYARPFHLRALATYFRHDWSALSGLFHEEPALLAVSFIASRSSLGTTVRG